MKCKKTDSIGVAFTYSEPLIWYEYLLDSMPMIKEAGYSNVLVSNGYINKEPLKAILPYIDAINVDLKGMSDEFYKTYCKASFKPVIENIELIANKDNVHLEITNLIIPELNDSIEDIEKLVKFIKSLSKDIPLHLSAYHPSYKMDIPPTSMNVMKRAHEIAISELNFVYIGNMCIGNTGNTYCPDCKNLLIERNYYHSDVCGLIDNRCSKCNKEINIII